MTTEAAPVAGEEGKPDQFEEKAKTAGWRPLAEFDGDPESWVDAKEFVKRAPLYEKNHKLKKELSELKATVHAMKGHIGKVSESAYKKAVADLQSQRDEAIDLGDRAQVHAIDKELREAEALKPASPDVHPAIEAWEKENGSWFYSDPEMSEFGMVYFQRHLAKAPGTEAEALEKMEAAVKKAFPEKFEKKADPPRKTAPSVESGGTQGGKRSFGETDLDDEQRRVMNRFVRQGVMSKEEYIKELADSGVIGGKK